MVLLNSVVQYFPNAGYLEAVLRSASALLAPGGRLVVGDVRHLRLLDAFHAAVELHHAQDFTDSTALWRRVQSRARKETELLLGFSCVRTQQSKSCDRGSPTQARSLPERDGAVPL